MAKRYEVISSRDGDLVFGADAVDYEARIHHTTALKAATKMARDNTDDWTGENLHVREVESA